MGIPRTHAVRAGEDRRIRHARAAAMQDAMATSAASSVGIMQNASTGRVDCYMGCNSHTRYCKADIVV